MKNRPTKHKKRAIKLSGIMAAASFLLCYCCQQLFYAGHHSHGVVILMVVFAALTVASIFVYLGLWVSKLGD